MKKHLSLIIIVLVIAALGAAAWWYMQKTSDAPIPAVETPAPPESFFPDANSYLPGDMGPGPEGSDAVAVDTETRSLSVIYDGIASDFWVDESDATLYTVNSAGAITATPYGGSPTVVYPGDGSPFVSAEPGNRGDLVIMTTGSYAEPAIALVNTVTGKRVFLPSLASAATWHPNNKDIVFLRTEDAKNPAGLYTFNVAGERSSLLAALHLYGVRLSYHNSSSILIVAPPSREAKESAWSFNINTKTLTEIVHEEPGLQMQWADKGTYGLMFASTPPRLALTQGSETFPLSFTTLPEQKCALEKTVFYCAVPRSLPSLFPDNYLKKASYTEDIVVRVNLSGEATAIWDSLAESFSLDVIRPRIINNALYFINRYDNKIYALTAIDR